MNKPLGLGGLAICLGFSTAVGAAEGAPAQPSAGVARAARPGCAKLVCQRRTSSTDDRGPSAEQERGTPSASGVSVVMGLGAGSFWGPTVEYGYVIATGPEVPIEANYNSTSPPPGASDVSVPIDPVDGSTYGYEETHTRRTKIQGPTLSLGVSLQQPLVDAGALQLKLEERLTFAVVLPLAGGSSVAGVGDILLLGVPASWPLQLGVGPSLAVAHLAAKDDDGISYDEPAVIAGGAGMLRLDLASTLPGSLDLVGHYGKLLNYEGSSYRDLQLAFALRL
jgi:hypothetical protein